MAELRGVGARVLFPRNQAGKGGFGRTFRQTADAKGWKLEERERVEPPYKLEIVDQINPRSTNPTKPPITPATATQKARWKFFSALAPNSFPTTVPPAIRTTSKPNATSRPSIGDRG